MTPETKRTSLVVLLALSGLLNVIFAAFAVVQKAAADESRIIAMENTVRSMELAREATKQQQLAAEHAHHAAQARIAAEQAHKECEMRSKKKSK